MINGRERERTQQKLTFVVVLHRNESTITFTLLDVFLFIAKMTEKTRRVVRSPLKLLRAYQKQWRRPHNILFKAYEIFFFIYFDRTNLALSLFYILHQSWNSDRILKIRGKRDGAAQKIFRRQLCHKNEKELTVCV